MTIRKHLPLLEHAYAGYVAEKRAAGRTAIQVKEFIAVTGAKPGTARLELDRLRAAGVIPPVERGDDPKVRAERRRAAHRRRERLKRLRAGNGSLRSGGYGQRRRSRRDDHHHAEA